MKKQETVGSIRSYNALPPIFNGKSHASFQNQNLSKQFKNTPSVALRYLFYTNVDKHYIVIQFGKINTDDRLYRFNITQHDAIPPNELNYDQLIASTHIATQHPVEAIAQVVVDFMTSQPKVKLLIEKDVALFQRMLNKFWPEFAPLFTIRGLQNGQWEYCAQQKRYDAYLLTK